MLNEKRVTIKTNVRRCTRCSQNHEQLEFYLFQNPVHATDRLTYPFWSLCPTTGEPVLLKIEKAPVDINKK